MLVLDTDVLIDVQRGHAAALAWFAGLAIGLVCSVESSLLIRSQLFGVQAWDAWTLSCVAVLLGLASIAASFVPARRAASVNPVEALRAE